MNRWVWAGLLWGVMGGVAHASDRLLVISNGPNPPYAYESTANDVIMVIPEAIVLGNLSRDLPAGIWQWQSSSLHVALDPKNSRTTTGLACSLAFDLRGISLEDLPLGKRQEQRAVRFVPGFGFKGGVLELEVDRLASSLSHTRLKIDSPAPPAARVRTLRFPKAGVGPLVWRVDSQFLHASNLLEFSPGPTADGLRLGLRGDYQRYLPPLRSFLLGSVEQSVHAFTDSRYNYERLSLAMALEHPVHPVLHLFEGSVLFHSRPSPFLQEGFSDGDLFAGVGLFGKVRAGRWFSTLTADTMLSERFSYYSQAFRLGFSRPGLRLTGTIQRVDPVIRSTPFYRAYFSAVTGFNVRGADLGLRLETGSQPGRTGYADFGPYIQLRF